MMIMMHISTVVLKCGCHIIIMLQQHNPDQPIKSIEKMLKVVHKNLLDL